MFSLGKIFTILAVAVFSVESSGVAAPVVEAPVLARAAPLVAPAHVGYAHAIPQNIPPYASQYSVVNRGFAAPLVAPAPYFAAPAPVIGPSPYVASGPVGPAPVVGPAPYYAPEPFVGAAPYFSGPGFVGPTSYLAGPASAGPGPFVGPAPYLAGPGPYPAPLAPRFAPIPA